MTSGNQGRPKKNDRPCMTDLVIADLVDRKVAGELKYGVPLQTRNERRAKVDLYQELLDASLYTRQDIEEEHELFKALSTLRRMLEDVKSLSNHDDYGADVDTLIKESKAAETVLKALDNYKAALASAPKRKS